MTAEVRRPHAHSGRGAAPPGDTQEARQPSTTTESSGKKRGSPKAQRAMVETMETAQRGWMASELVRPVLVDRAYWASWASWGSSSSGSSVRSNGAHQSQSRL